MADFANMAEAEAYARTLMATRVAVVAHVCRNMTRAPTVRLMEPMNFGFLQFANTGSWVEVQEAF